MKIRISIIVALLLCILSSCSSPESVAESALQKIGDGRYSEPIAGDLKFTRELVEGNEFSLALVNSFKVESFIEGKEVLQNLEKIYFQKGRIFENWKLIEKEEFSTNLYNMQERYQLHSLYEENETYAKTDSILFFKAIEYNKDKIVMQTETAVAYIEEENVPLYSLRYKVDGAHIVSIGVIKHPEHGYKVVSFMWED